jgi:hypothetical protein
MTRREQVFQEFDSMTSAEINERGFAQTLAEKYGYTNSSAILKAKAEYFASKSDETGNAGMLEAFAKIGLKKETADHGWIKHKEISAHFKNPYYSADNIQDVTESFEKILKKYQTKIFKKAPIIKDSFEKMLIVTTTDDHVGMNPNPHGLGLFEYEYTPQVYRDKYEEVWATICKKYDDNRGAFDVLCLDNLGDEQDGWHGYTTRGGHKLPQNATNFEVAEVVMDMKIELLHKCIDNGIAKKVILRKVGNDNHSGDFGKIVNLGVKKAIEATYQKELVEVDILHKFIEQRFWGKHAFLLTHGKDEIDRKFGLPFYLNDKSINYLKSYIDHYGLNQKYDRIHLDKGDLHQLGSETIKSLTYNNFMSFAPASSYCQHNYANNAPAGFTWRIVHKQDTQEERGNIYFDYKKI